jgi:tripartite ATP-independent transporter DctP family solute receptor
MRFLCKRREFIALLGVEASASAMSAVTRSQQSRMPVEGYLAGGLQAHLLAILVIATLIVLAGTAGAREFRAADDQLEDYPTVQALQFMSRLIEERTGGRHRIRVFHSAQLGDESQTIEQTRLGAIDLNRTTVSSLGFEFSLQVGRYQDVEGWVPTVNALALPFLFRSADHLHQALDQRIGNEILAGLERYGFVGLTFYDSGARSIYNRMKPIRTIADMKGLRIRVQQSELMTSMITALGAEPVMLPYSQVSAALAAGLIDGAEHNWPSYVSFGHYRLAPYYTLTEHMRAPEILIMSLRAWEDLTANDRDIFRDAARKSSLFMRELLAGVEERSRREALSTGNTIIANFERKPFLDAMGPIGAVAICVGIG